MFKCRSDTTFKYRILKNNIMNILIFILLFSRHPEVFLHLYMLKNANAANVSYLVQQK